MSRPEPPPERLDALLNGRAAPETDEERALLALASELRASEPELPPALDRRIDELLRRDEKERAPAPPRRDPVERRRLRWPSGWRRLTLVGAPAAVALASALVILVQAGGPEGPAPPDSSELAPPATDSAAEAPSAAPGDPARSRRPPQAAPTTPTPPSDTPPPPPAPPRSGGVEIAAVVRADGRALRLRTGPGSDFPEAGTLADGATATVVCAASGTPVLGPDGTSSRWLRLSSGAFASRAFLVPRLPPGVTAVPDC